MKHLVVNIYAYRLLYLVELHFHNKWSQ